MHKMGNDPKKEMNRIEVSEAEPWYPNLSLESEKMPEIKDWKVGETYMLCISVKMTSKTDNKEGETYGSFDILEAGVEDKKEEKSENYPKKRSLS